jgi:hypothetical protein
MESIGISTNFVLNMIPKLIITIMAVVLIFDVMCHRFEVSAKNKKKIHKAL